MVTVTFNIKCQQKDGFEPLLSLVYHKSSVWLPVVLQNLYLSFIVNGAFSNPPNHHNCWVLSCILSINCILASLARTGQCPTLPQSILKELSPRKGMFLDYICFHSIVFHSIKQSL